MSNFKDRSYSDKKLKSNPNACFYCGGYINIYSRVEEFRQTKDHVKPKADRGILSNKNKVYSCQKCNKLKADMSPEEFLLSIKAYSRVLRIEFNRNIGYTKKVRKNLEKLILLKNPKK